MMITNEQSLLNNLSCVCFSAQTLSNPASSVIPQPIAVEKDCFTTLKWRHFSYLLHEDKYLLKAHNRKTKQQWKII